MLALLMAPNEGSCASSAPVSTTPPAHVASASPSAGVALPQAPPKPPCVDSDAAISNPLDQQRKDALTALFSERPHAADGLLITVLDARPFDVAAFAMHATAVANAIDLPLEREPKTATIDAETQNRICFVLRAVSALDHRDGAAALDALDLADGRESKVIDGLRAAARFVIQVKDHPDDLIDPTSVPLLKIDVARLSSSVHGERHSLGPAPKIIRRTVEAISSIRMRDLVRKVDILKHKISRRQTLSSLEDAQTPAVFAPTLSTVPAPLPETYGLTPVARTFARGEDGVLFFGQRYVASIHGRRVKSVIDIAALAFETGGQIPELFGAIDGTTLFLGPLGTRTSPVSSTTHAFVTAIDLASGKVLWRSEPRVSTTNLVIIGDYILSACTLAVDKSALFLLRSDTGEIVSQQPMPGALDGIELRGDELKVGTSSHILTFHLQR